MTTTEQARELAERLEAEYRADWRTRAGDVAPVDEAIAALRELADQVERLEGQKWDAQHTDTANTAVQLGLARDAAEAEVASLTKERDALREALTPSAETKFAYIGEFSFTIEMFNPEDDDWQPQRVTVPWDTTKEIMAAIAARAALNAGGER